MNLTLFQDLLTEISLAKQFNWGAAALSAISLADLPARKKQVNLPEGWQMNFEQKWVVYDLRV